MKRLLNERTGTLHRPESGADAGVAGDETACGALRHVPSRCITPVVDGERVSDEGDEGVTAFGDGTERCGRCFEDAGGY